MLSLFFAMWLSVAEQPMGPHPEFEYDSGVCYCQGHEDADQTLCDPDVCDFQ